MLRLHDSMSRSLREFVPLEPGRASIYLCGLTVQGPPHIGHARNYVTTDILRRWLEYRGYAVTYVRNVTDIDDKVLVKAAESGQPWWAIGYRNEQAIGYAGRVLGCPPPTYEPRATGHIPEMVELIGRLIDAGHAYAVDGDVFFDVLSYPDYGALSGQRVAEMVPAGDSAGDARKRDPRDFALWKAHKAGEPGTASWDTPWGRGRPGWHLECSAMATKYLGPTFDIHAGGLDLIFPHHENELAQSRAVGDEFARYWLHNGMLNLRGEKMSKSLGNVLGVRELAEQWRPVELRYFLGSAHYRSALEFTETSLAEAAAAYRRIENFVERAVEAVGRQEGSVPDAFAAAMDEDLAVATGLGIVHSAVRDGNTALDGGDRTAVAAHLGEILAMTSLLGLDPLEWRSADADLSATVDALVSVVLAQRAAARERKDYAAADEIRDSLDAAGVVVEDRADGPHWTVKR